MADKAEKQTKLMSMHTEGEWRAVQVPAAGWQVQNEDSNIIASMGWYQFPTEEMNKDIEEANAKLIAAAPDMFQALLKISKCNRTEGLPVDAVISMMEAIRKADETWLNK